MKRKFLIIVFISFALNSFAQDLSNLRSHEIFLTGDSIILDTLSIVPGSLLLFDQDLHIIPDSVYYVDYPSAVLRFNESLAGMKLKASYRVFPLNLSKPYYHKDTGLINIYNRPGYDPFRISGSELRRESFYTYEEIDKQGSIARGITFGNTQDVVVNSNLNLQLSGKISEDLSIIAAISDNNIPIQPEGSSQQIHEFDKVYIEVFNDRLSLIAGDYDFKGSPGYFLKFLKKGKGAYFTGNFDLKKKTSLKLRTTVSGSVSKGQVCRNSFMGTEGIQGPYRLKGSNNEQYIIILAGTERVYIDGRLMSRGLENDYIIDYNTAEITFTPNQLMTKDKRIIVEFEYAEKSYARFLLYNSNEFITKKGNLWINVYSEQDDKNQTLQQDLSNQDRSMLASIGDDIYKAVIRRADSVGFNTSEVLYKKADTLVNNRLYEDVYVYSTSPDSAVYRLSFSFVGEGKGNYRPVLSAANGKVYEWIAPSNDTLEGSYEPVMLLVTPKKKQVISLGGQAAFTSSTIASFEISLTNNDMNTFSSTGRKDNVGYAVKGSVLQDLLKRDTASTRLRIGGSFQLTSLYFDPVERFRQVEFERDWNLTGSYPGTNEHLTDVRIDFVRKNHARAAFQSEYLNRGSIYQGLRNNFTGSLSLHGFTINLAGSLLNSKDTLFSTSFLRHQALLAKHFRYFKIGIREEAEQNLWKIQPSDSMLRNSFSFQQYEIFFTNPDSARNNFIVNYRNRKDYLPVNNELGIATTGKDFNIGFRFEKNPGNRLQTMLTYRSLQLNDTALSKVSADQSLTGRLEHSLSVLQGGVTTSTFFEIGSGLEAKKEYMYLEVAPGQGIYTWTDYNDNDIKELDEFEVAKFPDQAMYIRLFTPTNAFIHTYTNQFNQSVQFQPLRFWRNKQDFRKIFSLFSDQFAYRIDRKNTNKNLLKNINPLNSSLDSPDLLTISTSIRNNFSFNKSGHKFGMDYVFQKTVNRILLANGFDTRSLVSNGFRIRLNAGNDLTLLNQSDAGSKSFKSELFTARDYHISFLTSDLSLQYQPGISFCLLIKYVLSDERNRSHSEHANKNDFGMEIRYNSLNKGNLTGKLNYVYAGYNNDPYTPVAYEMLQGLQPGHNGIWSFLFQRRLTGGLELIIEYSGRIFERQPVVHTGSMQVRWNF